MNGAELPDGHARPCRGCPCPRRAPAPGPVDRQRRGLLRGLHFRASRRAPGIRPGRGPQWRCADRRVLSRKPPDPARGAFCLARKALPLARKAWELRAQGTAACAQGSGACGRGRRGSRARLSALRASGQGLHARLFALRARLRGLRARFGSLAVGVPGLARKARRLAIRLAAPGGMRGPASRRARAGAAATRAEAGGDARSSVRPVPGVGSDYSARRCSPLRRLMGCEGLVLRSGRSPKGWLTAVWGNFRQRLGKKPDAIAGGPSSVAAARLPESSGRRSGFSDRQLRNPPMASAARSRQRCHAGHPAGPPTPRRRP